jgi:hypothetical protein
MSDWLFSALDYIPTWIDYQRELIDQPGVSLAIAHKGQVLLDTRGFGAPLYFWPGQVASQAWLDFDAFEEAFKKALEIHSRKYRLVVDHQILEKSFRRA